MLLLAAGMIGLAVPACGQGLLTTALAVDGNGMGGMDASIISDNPMAATANPAQLGMFSLTNLFSAST